MKCSIVYGVPEGIPRVILLNTFYTIEMKANGKLIKIQNSTIQDVVGSSLDLQLPLGSLCAFCKSSLTLDSFTLLTNETNIKKTIKNQV